MTRAAPLAAILLLAAGCATTGGLERVQTRDEEVTDAVTQVAFGAPLIISGSSGLAVAAAAAIWTLTQGAPADARAATIELALIGSVVPVAFIVTGGLLVATGRATLLNHPPPPPPQPSAPPKPAPRRPWTEPKMPEAGPVARCIVTVCGDDFACRKKLAREADAADDSVQWIRDTCPAQ